MYQLSWHRQITTVTMEFVMSQTGNINTLSTHSFMPKESSLRNKSASPS